jgi:plasmid stability protein
MAQVIVRNLDEQVVSSLKFKAELHGHSLEQELREILKRAAELTPKEKVALADRIAAMTPRRLADDSPDLIRETATRVDAGRQRLGRDQVVPARARARRGAPPAGCGAAADRPRADRRRGDQRHGEAGDGGAGDRASGAAATTALQQFLEPLPPLPPLAARALAIAGELRHPACDCFHLALAKTRDLKLITADRRLVARLAGSPWQDRCLRLWN